MRYLNKKLEATRQTLANNVMDGVSYQCSIELTKIAPDTFEVPPPLEENMPFPDYGIVFLDIETTSLAKTCNITQLSASFENQVL